MPGVYSFKEKIDLNGPASACGGVGVSVPAGVAEAVAKGAGVKVLVGRGVRVSVGVGVSVSVAVGVAVSVTVGVIDGLTVSVLVGLAVESTGANPVVQALPTVASRNPEIRQPANKFHLIPRILPQVIRFTSNAS